MSRILALELGGGINGGFGLAISVISVNKIKLCLFRLVTERITCFQSFEVSYCIAIVAAAHRLISALEEFIGTGLKVTVVFTAADQANGNSNDQRDQNSVG